jgi:copper transporter 1
MAIVLLLTCTGVLARNTALGLSEQQPPQFLGRLLAADPAEACVTAPSNATCRSFVYPDARAAADVADLCRNMPFMSACSVNAACKAPPGAAAVSKDPKTCSPFQLLATICKHDDMAGMSGCSSYNTLCGGGSVVEQCTDFPGMAHLITSDQANRQVRSICTEMTMDGCEKCMPSWQQGRRWSNCSLLDVYGQLCYDMPDMSQCAGIKSMCSVDPSLYPCCGLLPGSSRWGSSCGPSSGGSGGGGGGGPDVGPPAAPGPTMKMYFFNEFPFYLLFKSWTPSTNGQYAGAFLAIFFMAIVYEALQVIRYRIEVAVMVRDAAAATAAAAAGVSAVAVKAAAANGQLPATDGQVAAGNCCGEPLVTANGNTIKYRPSSADSSVQILETDSHKVVAAQQAAAVRAPSWQQRYRLQPQQVAVDVGRALLQLVIVGLAYLLMLAAMSFNVGIFFAVIVGITVGSFIFGRFKHYAVLNPDVCCGV